MKKLQNDTLQKFLDKVVDELKREKKYNRLKNDQLDIPFIISSIYQSFKNNTDRYKDFIEDLDKYSDYGLYIEDSQNDYNGLVDIGITLVKYINDANYPEFTDYDNPDYDYKFTLTYDERNWGYCECTPDMSDYREDKHCCGHGCDASFCSFELHKIVHVIKDTWHGDEHDYWEFEDEFYASDKELSDKKAEEDRLRKIEELKNQIETASKKLKELMGDKV